MSTSTASVVGERPSAPTRATPAPRRLAWTLAAVGLALLAAGWTMRVWRGDLAAPFHYTQLDDAEFYLALIRSIVRHGWYDAGSSLGAPFGQELADFPQGADNLNFVILRGLALFSSNPALIANLFFLLTFALAAGSASAVMGRLGVARGPALVAAVLFALLPYHFYRGEAQLLLSAYYSVPLAAYVFLATFLGEPLLRRRGRPGPRALAWASRRSLATVLICAVIASTGLYYAAFALVLLATGAIVALLAGRGRAAVVGALGCSLLIGAFLTANLSPSLIYRAQHGSNPAIVRSLADTETLALKPAQLLLPVQDHRLPLLRQLNGKYARAARARYCEQCYETLGTVGDVGMLWLVAGALAAIVGAGSLLSRDRLYGPLALGVLLSLLIASVGGLSSLLAYFLTPDVRGWNRMSLFIAFFSLVSAACLLQAGLRALARRGVARYWPAVAVGALLVLGVLDETSDDWIPDYSAARAEYRSNVAFFGRVQSTLGTGAAVFELPYVPFPEGYGAPITTQAQGFASPDFGTSYEEARGYIASTALRWSYGAMKGRPDDWESQLAAKPLALAVAAAALSGFQGLVIEPSGYQTASNALLGALRTQLKESPLVSRQGDLWFFDLRSYAVRLRAQLGAGGQGAVRSATLHPLRAECATGGITLIGAPSPRHSVTATFSVTLSGLNPRYGPLWLRYPDGALTPVPTRSNHATLVRQVRVPSGSSRIELLTANGASAAAVAPASYEVQVLAPTLTAAAYAPLASTVSSLQAGFPPPRCQLHPGRLPLPQTP